QQTIDQARLLDRLRSGRCLGFSDRSLSGLGLLDRLGRSRGRLGSFLGRFNDVSRLFSRLFVLRLRARWCGLLAVVEVRLGLRRRSAAHLRRRLAIRRGGFALPRRRRCLGRRLGLVLGRFRSRSSRCRCSGSRRRILLGQFGLQLGQLLILQLDQTLQLVQLAFQIGYPALQLGAFAAARIEAFLGNGQLVGQRLAGTSGIAGVAAGGGLAGVASHQTQLVVGLSTRRSRTGLAALGSVELTSTAGQAAAFAPGSVLFGDLSHGLGGGARTHLLFGRQTQHLAVLQAVDVAVDEGVGVQVLNGQHGLVNGAARYATGDFPESVVI